MDTELGQRLRRAREQRALTLEQVSTAIHIKPHYLRALEEGRWEDLPSRAQGRGFLRLYAEFLGLDWRNLLSLAAPSAGEAATKPTPSTTEGAPAGPSASTPAEDAGEGGAEAAQARPQAPPAGAEVQAAFAEIGRTLRARREQLGLSLDEVERNTHIRALNLQRLEEGRFDDLPSPVQVRGLLLHYARFLQLDPEPLLLRFAEALQRRSQAHRAETSRRGPWRRGWSLRLPERTLALGLLALTVLFLAWGGWQVWQIRRARSAPPTPPPVLAAFYPTPSAAPSRSPRTATPAPGEARPQPMAATGTPTPLPGPAQASQAPVQVYLVVHQRAYLRVIVDGEEQLAQRVLPGSTYFFGGQARVEVTTGNGAAIQVFYNQQDQGLLGRFGEAVTRVYTLTGVQTPTPAATPTPTPTVPTTPTPTLTPTLTPTPTLLP